MIAIIRTKGANIAKGIRKITNLVFGNSDARESYDVSPYGYDAHPISDINGVYCNTSTIGQPVTIGYINKNQKAALGESRMYSTNSTGVVQYNVWLRSSGEVLIGASDNPASYTNFLTKFNELKIGFDLLRTEVNALVTSYNAHTHLYVPALVPAPTTAPTLVPSTPAIPATATIDSSKATTIKTI